MDTISDKISQLYQKTFPLEKVRVDLYDYLNENPNGWFTRNHNSYVLSAYIELEENKYESVKICEEDEITILHYHSFLDFGVEFQFNIIVGIGRFFGSKSKSLEFFKIEKCLAKSRYSPDLTLYDIEFYVSEHNRK